MIARALMNGLWHNSSLPLPSILLSMPPTSRLKLKRTPAEQAEKDLRKAQRAARKAAKRKERYGSDHDDHDCTSSKRRRNDDALNDSDTEYGPQPSSSSGARYDPPPRANKPDYERIRAELEEERFRDKLWGAMGDDDRLDSVEASFNSYAHVPRRWRGGGMERMDDELDVQPQYMEDEDYAEWIRAGMWR